MKVPVYTFETRTHFIDVQFARFRSVATRGSLMRLAMPRAEGGGSLALDFPRFSQELVVSLAKSRRLENINGHATGTD